MLCALLNIRRRVFFILFIPVAVGKVLNLERPYSHSFKEIFGNFSFKLQSVTYHTGDEYTVHRTWNLGWYKIKTINMYGAVYVACVIVLIIQTAECSCPCETEQQCKIIKDDNRKEVMLQSFFLWSVQDWFYSWSILTNKSLFVQHQRPQNDCIYRYCINIGWFITISLM